MSRVPFDEATRDEIRHFRWAASRQRARMLAARTPAEAADCRARMLIYEGRCQAARLALQKWEKRR